MHCRPHRGRTMLIRWWLPVGEHLRRFVYADLRRMLIRWWLPVGEHLRRLQGFLYCSLPPGKAAISPPLSADIPARVRRYLRPHSAIPPSSFLRFSSLFPLFYLSSNLSSIPVQFLSYIARQNVFFLRSTPSVRFLTAGSPLFPFYFRQFPAQSAPFVSIKLKKVLFLKNV